MRKVSFASQAQADITEIFDWIVSQDAPTACLVVDRIEDTAVNIATFPQIGKATSRANVFVFGGSRKLPFRITYSYDDQSVTILRVFRTGRRTIQF